VTDVVSFEDLVTAATVGVARRPVVIGGLAEPAAGHAGVLDDRDPAAALLDAAALLVAGRRAGTLPVRGITAPEPAGDDAARDLSARAARVLRQIAAADQAILADLLTAAAAAGYRAPAPLLPELLDMATRSVALRPAVIAAAGSRGRWLAARRDYWKPVADAAVPDDDHGLAGADEPTLERALDDRRQAVRATARRLLAAMPGSAFSRRAAERAAAVLNMAADEDRRYLVATLPGSPDASAARDGIEMSPPSPGVGVGGWRLTQLIAAAPLKTWTTRFGLDPAQVVALPVAGNLAADVHAGWRLAAIRQRDAAWAEAILTQDDPALGVRRTPAAWPGNRELLAVLPPAARDAAGTKAMHKASDALNAIQTRAPMAAAALADLADWPPPWTDTVAETVVALIRQIVTDLKPQSQFRVLVTAAVRNVPVSGARDYAAELMQAAESDKCPQAWVAFLRRAAETITLRRVFYEEIR